MPFAGYENFDECVRKNKDKEDPKAYCAEIKRKTEKSVQSVDVFDESDTPAIDKVVDKFAKGGPGSGQKGHKTTGKDSYDFKRKKVDHKEMVDKIQTLMKDKEQTKTWDKDTWKIMSEVLLHHQVESESESGSTSKTFAIDALIQKEA